MAPVPRGRTSAVSYTDSLCFWSPTGEHLYQLADLDLGRGRHTVVDQCRDCGDLAFPPIQTARPHGWKEWWRPSHRDKRSAAPDRESPRQPKQTGAFTLVLARTGETGSAARRYTAGADTDESVRE